MSYRLLYTPRALSQIERSPRDLLDCIEFHLGELARAPVGPDRRLYYPYREGMGYYFVCRQQDGTQHQVIALYAYGQDEETLVLLGLARYPFVTGTETAG